MNAARPHRRLLVGAVLAAAACGAGDHDPALEGKIPFRPERPTLTEARAAAPYTGPSEDVREAQRTLATGLDLHAKVVYRTCSPNGGVCHNNKEYPDLHTPANFLAAIEAPCNVQPGTYDAVWDRCERPGDRFKLGGEREVEIGYIEYIPGELKSGTKPDRTSPGLHVQLAEPIGASRNELSAVARFIRGFVNPSRQVEELAFASFETRWWILDEGRHVVGQVNGNRVTKVQELVTVGIVQGDHNRNGTFGARMAPPLPLIRRGRPEESYLIGRLRGLLGGMPIPGTRMPLANQPLSIAEMLALYCFVEGLDAGEARPNLASAIDYEGCSYSKDPDSLNLLGSGVTWTRRVKNVLEFNCGGCHSGKEPQGGLVLKEDVETGKPGDVYRGLLAASKQRPGMPLVTPGKPDQSYLWLKLTGEGNIVGARMPWNPLTGEGRLKDAELRDIKAWIEAGAVENE